MKSHIVTSHRIKEVLEVLYFIGSYRPRTLQLPKRSTLTPVSLSKSTRLNHPGLQGKTENPKIHFTHRHFAFCILHTDFRVESDHYPLLMLVYSLQLDKDKIYQNQ